jgi:hypothetical protein
MADNPINNGEIASCFNRTERTLEYMVDGRRYTLKPGLNTVMDFHIPYAMKQNVVPGSGDPNVPSRFESLVGIPGRTNCDPLPEGLDRSLLPRDRQNVVDKAMPSRDFPRGRTGIDSPTEGFTDPGARQFGG